jgi:hypothetical protein
MGHATISMTYDTYGHWFPNPEGDHEKITAAAASLFVVKNERD